MWLRYGIFLAGLGALMAASGAARLLAADESAQDSQVRGAVVGAVGSMLNDLSVERLTPDVTVGEFLRRTNGADQLARTLERGELLGGPRWIDKQTCQVQLQISGARILAALKQIAVNNPHTTPLPPETFDRLAQRWRERDFTSSGTTTSAVPLADLRPHGINGPWAHVRDEDRARTITNARRDAVERVLASLRHVPLTRATTVGDVLEKPALRHAIEAWLAERPITRVEFRRDLEVELVLNVTPTETLDAIRSQLSQPSSDLKGLDLPSPSDDAAWSFIHGLFERHMAGPVGHAAVPAETVGHRPVAPAHVPAWVETHADEVGIATLGESKLKSSLRAEARAREKLRERIESLSLSTNATVGQTATQDPHVRDAVSRAVSRATIMQTDYDNPRGSVSVHVSLDLREFWAALHDSQ